MFVIGKYRFPLLINVWPFNLISDIDPHKFSLPVTSPFILFTLFLPNEDKKDKSKLSSSKSMSRFIFLSTIKIFPNPWMFFLLSFTSEVIILKVL